MTKSKYQAPKQEVTGEIDPIFTSRIDRTLKAFEKERFGYSPEDYQQRRTDLVEYLCCNLMREYGKELTEFKLISISRVLIKPGQFQFEDGTYDEEGSVTSALVYKIQCTVLDDIAKKNGYRKQLDYESGASSVLFKIGAFQRPIVIPTKFSRDNKVIDAKIEGYRNTFYIKDEPKAIKDIYAKWGKSVKAPTVCIAALHGESLYTDSYSLVDPEDFLSADINSIIQGNKVGIPAQVFEKWQDKKKEFYRSGKFTKKQLDSIKGEDLVNFLAARDEDQKAGGLKRK